MAKYVLIPDSFKGTLSSEDICRIASEEILRLEPEAEICAIPVADGGEGTVDAFLAAVGGTRAEVPCTGPCGQEVMGFYGLLPDGTAVVEMAAAAGLPLAGGLVLLSFLLILARIDARTQLLPDRLTLPLLWAGLLFNLNEVYIALPDAVAGAMAGYLALWSVYWLFRLLTGKEALGYGDFKLLAALGAWCGWQVLPQVLLLASASGLVWTLLQRLWTRQSLQQPLAFGPWLALAGGGIFLWQQMV